MIVGTAWLPSASGQGVPIRLSFKFILNGSSNRPPTGAINTDAEVIAQVERGNAIFSRWISEFRIQELEIVDVEGAQGFYNAGTSQRDSLRNAAVANPGLFHWRTDAINFYITAADDSAISDFPPNNNIVLVCQGAFQTTVAHELGHSLFLLHTHSGESDGCLNCGPSCTAGNASADGCTDTLPDTRCWDQDAIATNAYGAAYAALNPSQRYQVDLVWSNLMSYHNLDDRWMLSPCQLDRMSAQCYVDRNWLLSKSPVYVDAGASGAQNGSFTQPYQTIQQAINSGILDGKVLVLETGAHAKPSGAVNLRTDMVTRRGASMIRDAPPEFSLPCTLEDSTNTAVRQAIVRAQQADRRRDIGAVVVNLLEAEKHAAGRERDAIRLELAQRLRDSQRFEEAASWFQRVADNADQPGLKRQAQARVKAMKNEVERQKK